jgi:hypothetical protein
LYDQRVSESETLQHDVSFPTALRVALCVIGIFVGVVVTYELWRGVWPLNVTSPFFGLIMLGGWGGAFAAISSGLGTSQRRYVFRPGVLEVTETWIRRSEQKHYDVADIVSLQCKEQESSDGPNMHYVEIAVRSGETFKSRMFDTEATAKRHAEDFKRVLGM